ncbi:MAG: hypothetical protein GY869_32050 [Planctomycetes bacterium]|nr:hypothetical protein [Planctomycetota bacterium]
MVIHRPSLLWLSHRIQLYPSLNRIPPKGFNREKFAEHQCEPVGADYADGQYWDDIDVPIPADSSKVVFRLMYQSVSWEYIKFLAEENKTDEWGRRLYGSWTKTGYCAPTVLADLSHDIN